MKSEIGSLLICWILLIILTAAQPWFSQRNIIFGVVYKNASIWKPATH